jgi:UPF0042 nucleotide-binding protein
MLTRELKTLINDIFLTGHDFSGIIINVLSFGFKYGLPRDADIDVRFLPNPFYNPDLRMLNGMDRRVRDYVIGHDVSVRFLESLLAMLRFLIPHYISEGKNQLIVSIGPKP